MQRHNKRPETYSLLFFIVVVIHVGVSLFLSVIGSKYEMPIWMSLIVSEMIILVPGLAWMLIHNASFRNDAGFKPIKIGTIFLAVLLAYLLMPLISLVNVISQLFTENAVVGIADQVLEYNSLLMILIMGFFGPFCEELIFRGIILNGMKRYTSILLSSLVSALFFGLMHLNINQCCYAFVLGIIFGIVNHVSGSIYTSVIMHTVINTHNVVMLMVATKLMKMSGELNGANLSTLVNDAYTKDMLYFIIGIYLILALIFTAVAIPVFVAISRVEGREDTYRMLTVMPDTEQRTVKWGLNIWSILACVLCVVVMFFLDFLLEFIK